MLLIPSLFIGTINTLVNLFNSLLFFTMSNAASQSRPCACRLLSSGICCSPFGKVLPAVQGISIHRWLPLTLHALWMVFSWTHRGPRASRFLLSFNCSVQFVHGVGCEMNSQCLQHWPEWMCVDCVWNNGVAAHELGSWDRVACCWNRLQFIVWLCYWCILLLLANVLDNPG